MTDTLDTKLPYSIGATVAVYQDPITQKQPEGDAVLVRVVRAEPDGGATCDVRFPGEEYTYRRTIYPPLNTEARTPDGYIATSGDRTAAMWGIGDTPSAALADARDEAGEPVGVFVLIAATARLIDQVGERGGWNPRWSVFNCRTGEVHDGVLPTDPDDVRDYLVADLDTEEAS